MATSASKLKLPQRPPRYRFALTPLADAMFQLLIFFMLSSSLTPYSLITLRTSQAVTVEGEGGGGEDAPPPDPAEEVVSDDTAIWTVDFESVLISNTPYDMDRLADLAAAMGSPEDPADVVLIVRETATVQDVTHVMEALRNASIETENIGSVRVTKEEGGS